MKITEIVPPRSFEVGFDIKHAIHDCARIELADDEQVTFVTESGAEYDVTRKNFGFYATPSMNSRLAGFGLLPVLVRNRLGRVFLLLVEKDKEAEFDRYLSEEQMAAIWRFSTDAECNEAAKRLEK